MIPDKEIREWLNEVLKEYKVDADEEMRVNREIGILERKKEVWDQYIQHLEKIKDSRIQEVLLLCETEKDELDEKLRKAEEKRARSILYNTLGDFMDEL